MNSGCGFHGERQTDMPVRYGDVLVDAGYRIDLIVDQQVILEVKAVQALSQLHIAQVLTYLLAKLRVGLLLNFNVLHLRDGIKRVVSG